ncbi:MAG: AAA family ATPase [Candidatus Omnitrophica bacterium CG_4_9_14_0_2_um_filter_42_8]|nr:MAG: AAA family ATPase [Candidatus Omnitrophica bacterium CG22_combo_CG10-13_8_21_14_all_43_16]PJC47190.1 MAG: AAA family ATPase [Candidatus Omnitrophica bacterium CG_4_9_14_0_2_um_filter_42_8]
MPDLFESNKKIIEKRSPLAVRVRPRSLKEFVGQEHILGEGKLLKRAIDADRITSLILYGPPGTGKTTLAHVIANATKAYFHEINAVISNVQELKDAIKAAKERERSSAKKTILFIDEIHRFNKAQQDVLMPDIESGNPVLIGATTHNPFFSLVSPLISRSIVFELKKLSKENIIQILKAGLKDKERGLGNMDIKIDQKALDFLADSSDGDARIALNALEVGAVTTKPAKNGAVDFNIEVAEDSIQKKAVMYDKDEDGHYDTISAFIKSMRGSDPDAALYWLAKMLYAGEDPRFIARRIVICAAEDVGNADPQALVVANAAFQISEFVGMPEARIPLAQAVCYIACAPKSNAAYLGIDKAMKDVEVGRTMEVPKHLKDASYRGAKKLGHGAGYKYSHDYEGHYVDQEYIPEKRIYYEPIDSGYEKKIKEYLDKLRKTNG